MAPAAATIRKAPPARLSRAALVRQALASFAVVVVCYWLYWFIAVPLIEPGVEDRPPQIASENQIDAARGDVNSRQRAVGQFFLPDDWEANNPAVWQSGQMRLLFKTLAARPDGTVELRPCTVMFFPKEGGAEPQRPVIMRAVEGANIRFDQPIVLKSVDLSQRKFVDGRLLGPIRIYRRSSAPGAADDLEITTREIQMADQRAWTDEPVNFRLGRSYGSGRDLEILLGTIEGHEQDGVTRGASFRKLRLKRDVRMRLEMGTGPPAEGALQVQPTAVEPPIEITCRGKFEFEMDEYAASFHDTVDVLRLNAVGESDQLNCVLLTVYFARPGVTPPQPASPDGAPSNGLSQVRMIEARGDPVTVRSPAQGMYASCKGIDFIPGPPGTPGSFAAFGPGVIHGNPPNDPAGKYDAQWARQLRFEPDGPLQRATLRGATMVRFGQLGAITADEIYAWLSRKPPPQKGPLAQVALHRAGPAPVNADAWQMQRVLARRYPDPKAPSQGDVVIDGPQLHAVAATIEATVERPAVTPPPGAPPHPQPPTRPEQRPPQDPNERFDITGRTVHIQLVPRGEELAVASATIQHDAQLQQFATVGEKPQRSLLVKGDRLHVTGADTDATRVTIAGKPGYVEAGGLTLWGAAIELERRTNRLWIDGPGRLTMPITQDLDGQVLPRPQQLAIDWKKRMDFQSNTVVFEGTVVARSALQVLHTEKLESVLTRPVDFANPGAAAGGQAAQRPELAEVRSHGPTFIESRQFDERGAQTGFSQMELLDLSIHRGSGEIGGRGPGWVTHVSRGAGPPIFAPPGAAAAKPAAPAVPPGPPENQFTYLHVTFRKGMEGNINRRAIKFFDRTKTIYGPVTDWNAKLEANDLDALGPQGMSLDASALEVREMNQRPGGKRGWFELDATGGVIAEGQRFTAQGDRLTYDEEKDQLILRGDPAEMFLENDSGRNETRANEVLYLISRNFVQIKGMHGGTYTQPAGSQGSLFDRQPKPPAAPPP